MLPSFLFQVWPSWSFLILSSSNPCPWLNHWPLIAAWAARHRPLCPLLKSECLISVELSYDLHSIQKCLYYFTHSGKTQTFKLSGCLIYSVSHTLMYLCWPATDSHCPLNSAPASHIHGRNFSTRFSKNVDPFSTFFPWKVHSDTSSDFFR